MHGNHKARLAELEHHLLARVPLDQRRQMPDLTRHLSDDEQKHLFFACHKAGCSFSRLADPAWSAGNLSAEEQAAFRRWLEAAIPYVKGRRHEQAL